jgi:DNA-binding response OmpR family regulator
MSSHKRAILVAENHKDTADLLVYVLGYAGYEVRSIDDSIDALKLIKEQEFDLFLIGDLLPLGSSIGLARDIRKFNIFTPIVFHSARAYPADIQRGLSAGAQAYLVKPCDPNHLLGIVSRHIGFAQALPA